MSRSSPSGRRVLWAGACPYNGGAVVSVAGGGLPRSRAKVPAARSSRTNYAPLYEMGRDDPRLLPMAAVIPQYPGRMSTPRTTP